MDIEKLKGATCPDCNGSGVYQEYDDEFDRYHVHACAKCNGTGEIARQSVTDEQIRTALDYVNDYKKEAMEYDTSVGIFPPTSEEVRAWETVETALQAYQPWIPVSERLPTEDDAGKKGKVLAYAYAHDLVQIVEWKKPGSREGWYYTHWMPLPQAPKEDDT